MLSTIEKKANAIYSSLPNIKTIPNISNLWDKDSNLETIKKSEFSCGVNYISLDSMSELSKKIIESNNLKEKIDFFFETLIVDMKFNDKEWLLTSKNGNKFKSKYLICSTNLLLHKRSLKILNVNQIPLRKAIPINYDKKIDLLLNCLSPISSFFISNCCISLLTTSS